MFQSFKILSSIGHGGMGAVYKVRHDKLDIDMALKVLNKGSASGADFIRFQNEARTLSKLSHNHVARVYDFGIDDGTPYLAMDFIEGQTLEQYIAQHGSLSLTEFVVIFSQICSGLAHAHSRNIVHRDLKPGNIILSEDDNENIRAVIVDFGVAKLQEEMQVGQLTQSGSFIGSPLCSSPEQIDGGAITPAADMYALGCTMFYSLTGEYPFHGDTVIETLSMHRDAEPPLEKIAADVPEKIRETIATLLSKIPADRKWTASSLEDALVAGRLIRQADQANSEVAVTIPPRLRRIVSNEATAARIKLNFDLPTDKPASTESSRKILLFIIAGIAACAGIVTLFYYTYIVPEENDAKKGKGPSYLPKVQTPMDNADKVVDPKVSKKELAVLEEDEPEYDRYAFSFQSALTVLRSQQLTKASQMFSQILKNMGTRSRVGNVKRVDILCNLAACAFLQNNTNDFKKYFKMYMDASATTSGGQIIHLAKETAGLSVLFKKPEGAARVFRQFLELDEGKPFPEVKGCLLCELAKIEVVLGHQDEAFKLYKQSIDYLKSSNLTDSIYYMDALTALGGLEFVTGKLTEARLHLEEVYRLVPVDDEEGPFKDQRALLLITSRILVDMDFRERNVLKARMHAERGRSLAKMLHRDDDEKFFEQVLKNIDEFQKSQKPDKNKSIQRKF